VPARGRGGGAGGRLGEREGGDGQGLAAAGEVGGKETPNLIPCRKTPLTLTRFGCCINRLSKLGLTHYRGVRV
jgi:hypothetical protein